MFTIQGIDFQRVIQSVNKINNIFLNLFKVVLSKYRPIEKLKKRSLNYGGTLFILFIVSTPRTRIIYVLRYSIDFQLVIRIYKIFRTFY